MISAPTKRCEIIIIEPRLILLDCASGDAEYDLTHHLCHLDLHPEAVAKGQGFTPKQEAEADWAAQLRLDRPGTWDFD